MGAGNVEATGKRSTQFVCGTSRTYSVYLRSESRGRPTYKGGGGGYECGALPRIGPLPLLTTSAISTIPTDHNLEKRTESYNL